MQDYTSISQGVHYLTISADQAGQRIDNFLLALTAGVPKSHIYRIIRTGQIRVNAGRVKATYRLQEDDKVRIPPLVQTRSNGVTVPDDIVRLLEEAIIYEDDQLLAVNKPPGLAVHAGSGLHYGVIDAFRQSRGDTETRLELVHRLDRGTSGCLIIGKSQRSTRALQDLFRHNQVKKRYLGVCVGSWPVSGHTVNRPLRKNADSGGERVVQIAADGKRAVSHFSRLETIGSSSQDRASIMSIEIETGRTHQIRVHAASEGHAIVGDAKYAGADDTRHFRRLGMKRLYLHCNEMVLVTAGGLSLVAPTDATWNQSIQRLRDSAVGHS